MRPPGYRDQPGEYRTNIFTQTFTCFYALVQQPCGVLPRRHHRGDEGGEGPHRPSRARGQDPEDQCTGGDNNVLQYTERVTVVLFQKHEVNPIAAQKARSNNWDPKASSVLAAIQAQ